MHEVYYTNLQKSPMVMVARASLRISQSKAAQQAPQGLETGQGVLRVYQQIQAMCEKHHQQQRQSQQLQ